METLKTILEFELLSVGYYTIKTYTILVLLLIVLMTKIVIWLIQKTIFRTAKRDKLDAGNTYAVFQIIKY